MDLARTTTRSDNVAPSDLQPIASRDGRPHSICPILRALGHENFNPPEFIMIQSKLIPQLFAKSEYPVSERNKIESWCFEVAEADSDYRIASIISREDVKQARSVFEFIPEPIPWKAMQ